MKSVLVVHPQFEVIGGAEVVAAHFLRWLIARKNVAVNLLTLKPFQFEHVLRSTGIGIPVKDMKVTLAPCPSFVRTNTGRFELLKLAYLHRAAKALSLQADICISTYNEMDFGRIGFQYVHHPIMASKSDLLRAHIILNSSDFHFSRIYHKCALMISKDTIEGFRRNRTFVNSEFMREVVRNIYDIDAEVLYPGFVDETVAHEQVKWEDREFRFLAIGRISPQKEHFRLLDIFKSIHDKYPKAILMIVGSEEDRKHHLTLRRHAEDVNLPVELKTNVAKQELTGLMCGSKFFLHAKQYEHFGIAVLEAAKCGCIPFVHDSGGQREIVRFDELRYEHPQDLIAKIAKLIDDDVRRKGLLRELQSHVSQFSENRFLLGLERSIGAAIA